MRRYSRKDYTQLVDFPVEIVGRDGVVRRYSFEESVRLYQRRIASAALRYNDKDVVTAEVGHCRSRIEQLRRSYFARYGWSGIHVIDTPGVLAGEFAAEIAAFLRRWLDAGETEPETLEFSFLDDSDSHQVYFVRRPTPQTGDPALAAAPSSDHLLYLYRFEQAGTCVSRDAFFRFLKVLQSVRRAGEGVEGLVAFHHTADCGLILTGEAGSLSHKTSAPEPEGLPPVDLGWLEQQDAETDPLREGMALLREGDREGALSCFIQAYERNHFRRAGYIGTTVIADQLGQHVEAETAALMGTRYFPEDAVLHYHLAVARLRRSAFDEAQAALDDAVRLEGDPLSYALCLLQALLTLRRGQVWKGRRQLMNMPSSRETADADLERAHRWVKAQLAARSMLRGSALAVSILGGALVALGQLWAIVVVVCGLLLLPAIQAAWGRQLDKVLQAPGSKGLRLANPGALKRLGEQTVHRQ